MDKREMNSDHDIEKGYYKNIHFLKYVLMF